MASDKAVQTGTNRGLRVRDPFVVPVAAEKKYYLFASVAGDAHGHFYCFVGEDLANFSDWGRPFRVFEQQPGFWGTMDYWAPEAHLYRGKYYLFGTVKAPGRHRGTDICVSTTGSPLGPYAPHTADGPITPHDWECLDGTLFVDDGGMPWMVFCREWVSMPDKDGQMCAIPLSADLRRPIGEATVLFKASDAPWSVPATEPHVTDGPFLHRTRTGKLLMLWSTFQHGFTDGQYVVGVSRSESGTILGPWRHDHPLLVQDDGGHAMLFRDFAGQLTMAFHAPNRGAERPIFLPIDDSGDDLKVL